MPQSYPFIVSGTITLNGVAQSGVTVSVKNDTKNETGTWITNSAGEYAASLSDPEDELHNPRFPSGYDVGDSVTVSWDVFSTQITVPAGAGSTVGGQTVNIAGLEEDVVVTDEDLSIHFGFEWDEVTYTATALDEDGGKLPTSFVVSLRLDGVPVVSDQALDSSVYSQSTGLLTLVWYVPSGFGAATVDLQWSEQVI
jgi:hypothetical protein